MEKGDEDSTSISLHDEVQSMLESCSDIIHPRVLKDFISS